ncbi:MAG: hypothetical protein ACR2RE_30185 [Geminicoccaceae bacterium]
MAILHIAEYTELARDGNGNVMPVGKEPAIATQEVDFTAGEAKSSAFQDATTLVRLFSDTAGHFLVGAAPTATTAQDVPIAANAAEYFGVSPRSVAGLKISIVQ